MRQLVDSGKAIIGDLPEDPFPKRSRIDRVLRNAVYVNNRPLLHDGAEKEQFNSLTPLA
jgi:hypothetical protein